MLPKKNRLTVLDFYRSPYKAQRFSLPNLSVLIKDSKSSIPRFTITVPKSIDKRASFRHKTRRVIVESLRTILKDLKIKKDFMVKAKRILQKKEKLTIEKELNQFFRNQGFI